MYKNKLNKLLNLIDKIKTDVNLFIISDFLDWFYEKLNLHFNIKISGLDLQKGDIFYINLGKNVGSELNKTRPCLIYSKKFANKGDTVVIIPLRTYKGKIIKDLFLIINPDNENKLGSISILDITGIRQVSKKRIKGFIGKLNNDKIREIDLKLSKIFGLGTNNKE